MDNYYVVETEDNPSIFCDVEKGIIEMEGRSLPENVDTFYDPVIKWIKKYIENPRAKTTVSFGFVYLNSSSSKKVLEMLMLLKSVMPDKELEVNWNYRQDDEDMLDEGQDFEQMTKLRFNFNAIV